MTEKEIREVLRELCEELDRGARAVKAGVRKVVLPSVLGAGLAISAAACDREAVALYGVPPPDGGSELVPRPDMAYGLPDRGRPERAKIDLPPPVPPYMAPDDAGMAPLYAAPLYSVPAPDLKR